MLIEIRESEFDPWREISKYQQNSNLSQGSYGACSVFVGTMRDFNQGAGVREMRLEHYQGMTENLLQRFAVEVQSKYQLLELLILHRVGQIRPNDPIVLVAVWAAHRADAFDGSREMMEYLKSKATFWKQETVIGENSKANNRWVENCS